MKPTRVTREPVHPFTGKALAVSRPDEWVSFEDATHPTGRKRPHGVGINVRQEDGLAVVMNATADLPSRLGENVVYAEHSVYGSGLTVIVRFGVVEAEAETDRFVALSGQLPYQDARPCMANQVAINR